MSALYVVINTLLAQAHAWGLYCGNWGLWRSCTGHAAPSAGHVCQPAGLTPFPPPYYPHSWLYIMIATLSLLFICACMHKCVQLRSLICSILVLSFGVRHVQSWVALRILSFNMTWWRNCPSCCLACPHETQVISSKISCNALQFGEFAFDTYMQSQLHASLKQMCSSTERMQGHAVLCNTPSLVLGTPLNHCKQQ